MGPTLDLTTLENAARTLFRGQYPKLRQQFIEQHRFELHDNEHRKFPHSARWSRSSFYTRMNGN